MRSCISSAAVVGALVVMLSPRGSCSVKTSHPAPIEITISAINCRDGALASELNDAIRAELKRISAFTVTDSPSAGASRLQLATECVPLDSHLLVRLRLVDAGAKGATISSYNALVKRDELADVLRQSISRIAARAREAGQSQTARPAAPRRI